MKVIPVKVHVANTRFVFLNHKSVTIDSHITWTQDYNEGHEWIVMTLKRKVTSHIVGLYHSIRVFLMFEVFSILHFYFHAMTIIVKSWCNDYMCFAYN